MINNYRTYLAIVYSIILATVIADVSPANEVTKSGIRPQVIVLPDGPGAIEGLGESFEAQLNTGTGQYSVPFVVMTGRAGFAPVLHLAYNGGNGNSIVGMGWRLTTMCIKRQSDKGLPLYNNPLRDHPDTFITESGAELVRIAGNEEDERQTFRLKNEGEFTRYIYYLNEDRWECTDRSGRQYSLGARMDTTDVTARIQHPERNLTYAWYIAEAVDTNSNRILYTYEGNQQQVYYRQIEYGAVENQNSRHQIEFIYENRPDPIIDYRPTFRLVTAWRLKQVDMKTTDQLVRSYLLEYLKDRPLSMLSKVTLRGADGSSTLPPATFGYSYHDVSASASLIPLAGLSQVSILQTGTNPEDYPAACEILDFNGDSLPDFYQSRHFSSNPFEYDILYENLGNGQFARKPLNMSDSLGLKIQSESSFVQDINGDGLPDLVAQKGYNPEDFVFRLNEGGKWAALDVPFKFPDGETAQRVFKSKDIRAVDLNYDRKIDTLRSYSTVGPSGRGVVFAAYINRADGEFHHIAQTTSDIVKGIPTTFNDSHNTLVLADMNGDKMQDLVLLRDATSGGLKYWPAMGYGRFDDSSYGYTVPLTDGPDFGGDPIQLAQLEIGDLNGDGLADLYYVIGSQVRYWLNEGGTQFGTRATISLSKQFDPTFGTYRLMDIDADGLQDLVFYIQQQLTPAYMPLGFWYVRLFQDNTILLRDGIDNDGDNLTDEADEGNSAPNLLSSITNGIGRTISLFYSSHTVDMIRDRLAGREWSTKVPFPVSIIRRIDIHDGMGNTYRREMSYADGYYDGQEKEFRGFASVELHEHGDMSAPDFVMCHVFNTGAEEESLKGKLVQLQARDVNESIFYIEEYTWMTRILADGVSGDERKVTFPFQQQKIRNILERGNGSPVQLKWEYAYDDYGNLIRQYEHGRLDDGWDDERVTETTYTAGHPSGLSAWILDKVVLNTTKDEAGALVAQRRNYYDGNSDLGYVSEGNLTKAEDWIESNSYVVSVRNDYDEFGNVIAVYDPLYGSKPGHYREFVYDSEFHIFPVQEKIYTGFTILTISATYDAGFGVMETSTDFNGNTTFYGHDTFGRLISITRPLDTDHTIEYDYELAFDLGNGKIINWIETRQQDGSPDDGFLISRTFYDGLGRKIMTRSEGEDPDQIVVTDTVQFNARKQPWKQYLPYFETGAIDFNAPTFNSGFTEHFYDAPGREIRINQPVGPEGILHSTITYQPLSKFVQDEEQTRTGSNHAGCGMRYIEDGLQDEDGKGRLREVYEVVKLSDVGEPLTLTVEWKTTYLYDLLDNLTGYTDSQNNQKIIIYDGLGRKTFMNDPDRGIMHYAYDAAGNLLETVDAKDQIVQYLYDGANRLIAEYYGDKKMSPDVEYHYDFPAGKVNRGEFWPPISDSVTAENTLGFLSWVKDQSGEEHNSYDERGRVSWVVKRIQDAGNHDMRNFYTAMEYDSMDRVTTLTYPDQIIVNYTYNTRGLLESIPNVIQGYSYNPAGQNALLSLGCGIETDYVYDHRLRLSQLKTIRLSDGVTLQDLHYTYDGASNITMIIDKRTNKDVDTIGTELGILSPEARKFDATQAFTYDSLYRLTLASNPSVYGTINYRYDRIGNMIQKDADLLESDVLMDLGGMASGGTAGTSGRIGRLPGDPPGPHAVTGTERGPEGPMVFTYDDNGNMITDSGKKLFWDSKDRLIGLSNNAVTAQYIYDYSDMRKKKTVMDSASGTTATTSYIDKFSEIRNDKLLKYVYAGNNRIARSDVTTPDSSFQASTYYLYDHLGSTSIVVSDSAVALEQIVNYPYGHQRKDSKTRVEDKVADYRFSGKELDIESGLQYFEVRYYNPVVGSFISADPLLENTISTWILNSQKTNIYSYTINNPIIYVDPTGEDGILFNVVKSVNKILRPVNLVINYGRAAALYTLKRQALANYSEALDVVVRRRSQIFQTRNEARAITRKLFQLNKSYIDSKYEVFKNYYENEIERYSKLLSKLGEREAYLTKEYNKSVDQLNRIKAELLSIGKEGQEIGYDIIKGELSNISGKALKSVGINKNFVDTASAVKSSYDYSRSLKKEIQKLGTK